MDPRWSYDLLLEIWKDHRDASHLRFFSLLPPHDSVDGQVEQGYSPAPRSATSEGCLPSAIDHEPL